MYFVQILGYIGAISKAICPKFWFLWSYKNYKPKFLILLELHNFFSPNCGFIRAINSHIMSVVLDI